MLRSPQFPKRSAQPLRQDSYRRAARRVRHLVDIIEREPATPHDHAVRTRAINNLSRFAQHFARHHAVGKGGY